MAPPTANERMIATQIEARGVRDGRVLAALRRVDRAWFVPPELLAAAYDDCPLAISHGQTISQPYIVGLMTALLDPQPDDRVLEVGTGTGYQTAILAELAGEVWSVEVIADLAVSARRRLSGLGYARVSVVDGNGWDGLAAHAPFDGIVVTAAPDRIPERLCEQLAPGGRLVLPVGVESQELWVVTRRPDGGLDRRSEGGVRFVPMVR